MKNIQSKTVVFITGAFVHHSCWDDWKTYFESKEYSCIAPAWLYKDAPAKALRSRHPDAQIASIRLNDLTEYYANIVEQLPEKPILIGHSMGGLITQILVSRNLAAAGVAVHSVPPQGVIPYEFSFYKAGWKALGLFTSTKKTYLMSFKDWQYAFTGGMPLAEQKEAYEKYVIPESKLITRDAITSAAKVDFSKPHAPLLLTSGETDRIIPASLNLRNFKKYKTSDSVLDYKEFPGRNHFVLGQASWKEDADYILNWLETH